eukprot:7385475-Prymnesium_polylepis.2
MVVADLELLAQAKRDERATVELIRDEGLRRRKLQWHVAAWRNLLVGSGPARREALRSLLLVHTRVHDTLDAELLSGERDVWSCLAAQILLSHDQGRRPLRARAARPATAWLGR